MVQHYKVIQVHEQTKKRLIAIMRKGTTYDKAINVLMDEHAQNHCETM